MQGEKTTTALTETDGGTDVLVLPRGVSEADNEAGTQFDVHSDLQSGSVEQCIAEMQPKIARYKKTAPKVARKTSVRYTSLYDVRRKRRVALMALHHASPAEIVDLSPMGSELRNNHTAAIVKTDEFEAVRLVVQAGALLKQHQVPGSITLHCLEGRVELGLGASSVELKTNEWLYLEGNAPHSVYGLEDSSLLLTIILAKPKEKSRMAAG